MRGYDPAKEKQALGIGMRAYLYEDLMYAKVCYEQDNRPTKWWTPDSDDIDTFLRNKLFPKKKGKGGMSGLYLF